MIKNLVHLVGALAIAVLSQAALAQPIAIGSQISTGGTLNVIGGDGSVANATGLDFTFPGGPDGDGVLAGYSGTGQLSDLFCTPDFVTPCGFIKDIASFSAFTGLSLFLNADTNFTFDLRAPLTVTRVPGTPTAAAALILSGEGILFTNNFDPTRSLFTLVTLNNTTGLTTYSATLFSLGANAVPEPGTIFIMGLGLAGLLVARRKSML